MMLELRDNNPFWSKAGTLEVNRDNNKHITLLSYVFRVHIYQLVVHSTYELM